MSRERSHPRTCKTPDCRDDRKYFVLPPTYPVKNDSHTIISLVEDKKERKDHYNKNYKFVQQSIKAKQKENVRHRILDLSKCAAQQS